MNRISLDSIGIAGFSHDFGTLMGEQCDVADMFNSLVNRKDHSGFTALLILAFLFPSVLKIRTKFTEWTEKLNDTMEVIASELLEKFDRNNKLDDRSVIGLLGKAPFPFFCK
jgi:hypothetical protein